MEVPGNGFNFRGIALPTEVNHEVCPTAMGLGQNARGRERDTLDAGKTCLVNASLCGSWQSVPFYFGSAFDS